MDGIHTVTCINGVCVCVCMFVCMYIWNVYMYIIIMCMEGLLDTLYYYTCRTA